METLSDILDFMDGYLGSAAYFPILLLLVGVWFTFYLGFPQVRYFKRAFETLQGKHTRADAEGDTSHFQALSTALSGTIGTGNIGGVAFAIFLGGPAALFWMWATAFVGMTTKFVEVTISHKYREKDRNGQMAGGPMYFMEHGMNAKWLAVFFAIATVISSSARATCRRATTWPPDSRHRSAYRRGSPGSCSPPCSGSSSSVAFAGSPASRRASCR